MTLIINSNNSWQKIQFYEKDRVTKDNKTFLLGSISFSERKWNKKEVINGLFNDLALDKELRFNQICIEKTNWDSFINSVTSWIDEGILFQHEFYNDIEEYFTISLDANSKLISSKEKPVLSMVINDTRSKFEFDMIIDRTSFTL
jgi:hypothetical protein